MNSVETPLEVDGHRLREPRQAGIGQRDDDSAAVGDGARPSDEPLLDQAVDATASSQIVS